MAAICDFYLMSMDIRAAFLQLNYIDRVVYVKPPNDTNQPVTLCKLKKPLYGLDNASRKFWLKMKNILKNEGMEMITGDKAFYYKHK